MTTLVRGPIKLVTDRPDTVRKVNLRAPELRLHGAGIVTAHNDDIPVVDGQVEFEALPGPAVLTLVTAGGAPLRSVDIVVPDEDTATLSECLDQIYVYDPPVVGRAQQFAREAGEFAARAEAGADRVGSAEQVGAWVGEAEVLHDDTVAAAEHAETQAGIAAEQAGVAAGHAERAGEDRVQTGADRRQTGEDRAQTGRDAEAAEGWAGQSKDAATLAITSAAALERHVADRDPTADDTAHKGAIWVAPGQVWIRGEDAWHPISVNDIDKNYVDAQDQALRKLVDDEKWKKGHVGTNDTLDTLAEGSHEVLSGSVSLGLGIPYGVTGTLEIFDTGDARNALYITNHVSRPRVYANARVRGSWSGWKMQANADDLAGKADKSALAAKADRDYVDESIAALETGGDSLNMALLGAPVTPWEIAGIVTNYDQGELYLDQVKTQFAFVKKVTVGQTYLGKDVNALVVGDDTKPVVMIECGTHGNEVAPREAVMIWARKAAQYRTWMDHICLVIIPTVNGDRTGHNRENAQSKDINRDFGKFETSEAQAVRDTFDTYNPIFYLCCHEFEHTTDVNDIETSAASNYAWYHNQYVRETSQRVVDKIWTAVQDKGAKVDHYYTTSATEPEGPVDTAMSWLMRVKEVPSILIETAGGLYPKTYSQSVGVHPARYNPPLGWRVDLYHAALDASLDEISSMVQEQVIQ